MLKRTTGNRKLPRLHHLLHPVHSAKSLYHEMSLFVYRRLAKHQFRNIRRGQRDRCWCGGELLPFKWHSGYGVCAKCGCYINKHPPVPDKYKKIYSSDCYWGIVSKMRGWPTLSRRVTLYKTDGRLNHCCGVRQHGGSHGSITTLT